MRLANGADRKLMRPHQITWRLLVSIAHLQPTRRHASAILSLTCRCSGHHSALMPAARSSPAPTLTLSGGTRLTKALVRGSTFVIGSSRAADFQIPHPSV